MPTGPRPLPRPPGQRWRTSSASAREELEDAIKADTAHRREAEAAARAQHERRQRATQVLTAARAQAAEAGTEVERAREVQAEAEAELTRLEAKGRRGEPRVDEEAELATSGEDAEIYVLSRLATARSVDTFGALPLILVDPFVDLGFDQSVPVLDLVARMAAAVQVVYLTEDPRVVRWAGDLGPERANVLRFSPDAGSRA